MPLLDLNDDILHHLWQHVHPCDIVNFALTKRRIHTIGRKRLSEHQELVNKYTVVCINSLDSCKHQRGCGFRAKHPVDVLIELADKPIIASYIRSITVVRGIQGAFDRDIRADAGQRLVKHQVLDRLKYEDGEYVWGRPKELNANRAGFCASLAVLLTHVTSLRHMELDSAHTAVMGMRCKLHKASDGTRIYSNIAAKVAELEVSLIKSRFSEPLAKYINGSGNCLTIKIQRWWHPHTGAGDHSIDRNGTQLLLRGCSELRHLRMLPAMCKPSDFGTILRHAPNLESFRYQHGNLASWLTDGNDCVYYSTQPLYKYLNAGMDWQMREVKMLVELVGDLPDQEIRITKRKDIDRGQKDDQDLQKARAESQGDGEEGLAQATVNQGQASTDPATDEARQGESFDVAEPQKMSDSAQDTALEKPTEKILAE